MDHIAHHASRPFGAETFTLTAGGGGGFDVVAAALARKLASLAVRPERLAVVVSLKDRRRAKLFTQTLVDREAGAWVEAVSNQFIGGKANHLDDERHRLLAALGFDPPSDFSPNHHLLLGPPVDWSFVAGLLVRTLEAVYGATARTRLRVKVFDVGRPPGCKPAAADLAS